MKTATSRELRRQLSNKLTQQTIQINQNYAAKSILKVINRPSLTRAFDQRLQRIYRVVDHRVAKALTKAGFTRGGRAISRSDFTNIRNAINVGKVGMDRDVGLNQMLVNKWQGVLKNAQPGTEWYEHAQAQLRAAQKASQLGQYGGRVSYSTFQHEAQRMYNEIYKQVTGASAKGSLQQATGPMHPEAYADPHVLLNNPVEAPFSRMWAHQTGSVSALKVHGNFQMVKEGVLSKGNAIQESARGLAKDLSSKLLPLLKSKPGVDPGHINYWQGMHQLLKQAGDGNIRPGELLQVLGTDETGVIRLGEQASAIFQSVIQSK
jgi:hypothetical protein